MIADDPAGSALRVTLAAAGFVGGCAYAALMIATDRGDGFPVVMLHGFGVDQRILEPLDAVLAARGCRRLYMALPWTEAGHDPTVTSTEQLADQLVSQVSSYLAGASYAVLGNSYGGQLARYLAHAEPEAVAGVATMVSVYEAEGFARTVPERVVLGKESESVRSNLGPGEGLDVQNIAQAYRDMAVVHTEAGFRAFSQYVWPGITGADQQVLDKISQNYALSQFPEEKFGGPYDKPSLHVFGRQDHVTGYRDGMNWEGHYTRGTFAVLDAAGHNVHLEQPDLVNALVGDWIDRVLRAVA